MLVSVSQSRSGTEHLQGYLEVKVPCRLTALKRLSSRSHWEKARGTREQCVDYCSKTETSIGEPHVYIEGEWNIYSESTADSLRELMGIKTGTSSSTSSNKQRLLKIQSELSKGDSTILEDIADNEFDLWVRHYRAFERYLLLKTKPRNHEVEVHVLQGPTGTGKSRWALDNYPGAYWKQRSQWWDGYTSHETVVIDEFYGWLPFDLLLRVCDRYPLLVETKGGQVQFVAKRIIITTNQLPSQWYRSVYFPSFVRRVTEWHVLPVWGDHQRYFDYGLFCSNAVNNTICP